MPTDFIRAPRSISLSTGMFSKQDSPYKLSFRKYLKQQNMIKNNVVKLKIRWYPSACKSSHPHTFHPISHSLTFLRMLSFEFETVPETKKQEHAIWNPGPNLPIPINNMQLETPVLTDQHLSGYYCCHTKLSGPILAHLKKGGKMITVTEWN